MDWFKKHLHLTWLFYMLASLFILLLIATVVGGIIGFAYFVRTMWSILSALPIFPISVAIDLDKVFTGQLKSLMDLVLDISKVFIIGLSTAVNEMQLAGQGQYSAAIGSALAQLWLMITPFPIAIWVLKQKNRSWAWSLFTLWTLSWVPLVLSNKAIVKPTVSDSAQPQTSESHQGDGCNETHTHSDKVGDI